jgi:hypothetical protein
VLASSIIFFLTECSSVTEMETVPTPQNYIVLLDLSDRLLSPLACATDQELVLDIAERFSMNVRQNLTIRSNDKFKLRIVPQKGSSIDINRYENQLSLDMSQTEVSLKNIRLVKFGNSLPGLLKELYSESVFNKTRTSDFFGCDIWKYFHEQLRMDLERGYENHVIVLTDGYFDFENSKHALCIGQRFTSSDFYASLSGAGWKTLASDRDYGLIPVQLEKPYRCIVCGLNPKSEQLTELEKLGYFWTKWMAESNADTCILIPLSSTGKMKNEFNKQFKTE